MNSLTVFKSSIYSVWPIWERIKELMTLAGLRFGDKKKNTDEHIPETICF